MIVDLRALALLLVTVIRKDPVAVVCPGDAVYAVMLSPNSADSAFTASKEVGIANVALPCSLIIHLYTIEGTVSPSIVSAGTSVPVPVMIVSARVRVNDVAMCFRTSITNTYIIAECIYCVKYSN